MTVVEAPFVEEASAALEVVAEEGRSDQVHMTAAAPRVTPDGSE